MNLMGLGATFDRAMGNVWGQTEGTEARENMITGLFGPQTDIDRLPNWGRNLTTTGADPYLSGQMVASQINGIQGSGAMSEMKHFTAYNGQDDSVNSQLQDQALHEIYLTPYEAGFVYGGAAATMCSYQIWQDTAATLPSSEPTLASTYPVSPYGASSQQTWPLDESHYSCEQPLTLTYALRDLWGSKAMVGSDYGAAESASGINQGEDQEMPFSVGFSATNTIGGFGPSSGDPTGDTCANASGSAEPCSTPGAVHVAGIPGPGCPATGCTLVQAVVNGTVSLSVFNQDLATQLYQEQRFGMLGCNQTPVLPICTDPGGVGGDRTGNAPLPNGPTSGATPATALGTKTGDEAVVERESEEGGVLLRNDDNTLPVTPSDLSKGVLVTGPSAQYLIADPTTEASVGFVDRDQISPLQQLEAISGEANAFTYVPALDPVGEPVPSSALSTSSSTVTGNLQELSTVSGTTLTSTASTVHYTAVSSQGQVSPGSYAWSGYLYVPTTDTYSLDFQFSNTVPAPASHAITAESWSGGTATLTVANGTAAAVGSQVTVANACPAGYDGTYAVTGSTTTSVSYVLAANPGACSESLAVTGASYSPGFSFGPFSLPNTATLDFAATTTPPAVGSTITVAGMHPSGYDGTGLTVTASTPTSLTYDIASNPGTFVSGGTVAVAASGSANTGAVQVSFNGSPISLSTPPDINSTGTGVPASPTNAGYTEAGLTNMQYSAGSLTGGTYYPLKISFDNTSGGLASIRFGYNRANGDISDAAAAAAGKSMAIVFLDDTGAASEFGSSGCSSSSACDEIANPYYNSSEPISSSNPPYISAVESLPANQTALVEAVAAANPNTVVVLDTENPVLMPWIANVKSVLEMWYAGEEGGTSTARLLLGLADPSGHLPITFPANATDTIWGYNETVPLYTGDTTGVHLERFNGNGGCSGTGCPADTTTQETEGIYTDYRFFDKEGITPLFPFGWGLSYTNFAYSRLRISPDSDGGLDVSFLVTNTGQVAGTAVPQVYLGAPTNQPSGVQFAVRQLAQFTRVTLQPRQTQQVTLHVALRQLQYWNATTQQWLLATGNRTVYVGSADSTTAPLGELAAPSSLPLQQKVYVSANTSGGPGFGIGATGFQVGPSSDPGRGMNLAGYPIASTVTCDDEQLSATVISGNLVVPSGAWCDIIDTTVAGNLVISAGSLGVRIADSTVKGALAFGTWQASDPLSSGADVLCNTTVMRGVSITGSAASAPWDIGLCGANTIRGSLLFLANAATTSTITGNSISGDLQCDGNGGVTASGNTVGGRTFGQCKV